jgi:hypothetical protein
MKIKAGHIHYFTLKLLYKILWIFLVLFMAGYIDAESQELEPRSFTNIPRGMNFVLVGYGYSGGNVLLDPHIPIDEVDTRLHSIYGGYVRSIKIFGLSGKVNVTVPWASGDYGAVYDGIDSSRSISGLGDTRIGLSVNFTGAPSLTKEEFQDYKPNLISGMHMRIICPTGQYDPDHVINLGSNRWVFWPTWGISKFWNNWILEGHISAAFFTPNYELLGDNTFSQNPLAGFKIHVIRSFKGNWWISLSSGYLIGGKTYINGELKDTHISTLRVALNAAVTIRQNHVLRLTSFTSRRFERGADFDAIALTYQFRWIKK